MGTVERAFQLARSGDCASLEDIRVLLAKEGYELVSAHLAGPTLRRALLQLCIDARKALPAA